MKKLIIAISFTSLIIFSCETKKDENINKTEDVTLDSSTTNLPKDSLTTGHIDEHNSKTSIDWVGTYEGVLPCADCEGIKTTLTINKDETFTLSQEYLNKNFKLEDKGKLEWSKDGGSIKITTKENGNFNYKVGENKLFSLDQEGKEITGSLADKYVLIKK